jgi:hypothetical protein
LASTWAPWALGDHADVEAGIEQLAGRELAKRKDRAVKHGGRTVTSCPDGFAALGGRHCEGGPTFAAPELSADRFVGDPASGRATGLAGAALLGRQPIHAEGFVLEGDRLCPFVRDAEMLLEQRDALGYVVGRHRRRAVERQAEDECVSGDLEPA